MKRKLRESCESKEKFLLSSIFTGQSAFVEKLVFSTSDQSWMTFSTEEETVTITGNGKTWEWPETGCW